MENHEFYLTVMENVKPCKDVYVYTPSQKFNTISISVLRDITKLRKKINHVREVKKIYFV